MWWSKRLFCLFDLNWRRGDEIVHLVRVINWLLQRHSLKTQRFLHYSLRTSECGDLVRGQCWPPFLQIQFREYFCCSFSERSMIIHICNGQVLLAIVIHLQILSAWPFEQTIFLQVVVMFEARLLLTLISVQLFWLEVMILTILLSLYQCSAGLDSKSG